jgi:calcineurin-like phosphoesterase family protein
VRELNLWFISDTHFGHENIYRVPFRRVDGSPLRPFPTAADADNYMIEKWNEIVKPSDHIYHLGDVVIDRKHLAIVPKLNGHKRLIRGNHDIFKTRFYFDAGFEEIYGVRVFHDMIFSHIPLHPTCINQRWKGNVHGHLHGNEMNEPRYLNISVEWTDYAPISLEQIREKLLKMEEKN